MSDIQVDSQATPATPASGKYKLYVKSDGSLYLLNSAGTEVAIGISSVHPGGRLTLASGLPSLHGSDYSGQTTVYWTPYKGDFIPIYNGSVVVPVQFPETSQTTTDNTKSPAAAAANSNYDIFAWLDGTTKRISRGPAWGSNTSRNTGAGTTELQVIKGIYTNKFAITNGPGANLGTYLGTIRTNSGSQLDWLRGGDASGGSQAWLSIWNNYNRLRFNPVVRSNANSWTYQSGTIRAGNNSATYRITSITGLQEDAIYLEAVQSVLNSATPDQGIIGIGVDDATSFSNTAGDSRDAPILTASVTYALHALHTELPFGFHFWSLNEKCIGTTAAVTFYGANASASLQHGGLFGNFMY